MWRRLLLLLGLQAPAIATNPPAPAEDWKIGDIAECIRDDWLSAPPRRPIAGQRIVVVRAVPGYAPATGERGWALELLHYAGRWKADAFRKLPPVAETSSDQVDLPAADQSALTALTSAA